MNFFQYNDVIQNDYSNDPNKSGVTWACELGNQMICPIRVENLSTPGQMLIEVKTIQQYDVFFCMYVAKFVDNFNHNVCLCCR